MHSPQAVSQVYVLWLAHLLRRHIFLKFVVVILGRAN